MVLRHGVGAEITLDNVGISLLSETPGRVVVAVKPSQAANLEALSAKHSIPVAKIGTTGGEALVINDATISLTELRRAHTETFKKLFG
jgi:phosphoribosylformylglycinamidine synthase